MDNKEILKSAYDKIKSKLIDRKLIEAKDIGDIVFTNDNKAYFKASYYPDTGKFDDWDERDTEYGPVYCILDDDIEEHAQEYIWDIEAILEEDDTIELNDDEISSNIYIDENKVTLEIYFDIDNTYEWKETLYYRGNYYEPDSYDVEEKGHIKIIYKFNLSI